MGIQGKEKGSVKCRTPLRSSAPPRPHSLSHSPPSPSFSLALSALALILSRALRPRPRSLSRSPPSHSRFPPGRQARA